MQAYQQLPVGTILYKVGRAECRETRRQKYIHSKFKGNTKITLKIRLDILEMYSFI